MGLLCRRIYLSVPLAVLFACAGEDPSRPPSDAYPIPAGRLQLDVEGRLGGTLRYVLPGEPTGFNFTVATNTRTQLVTALTTGTLLEFDRQEQKVRPGVVESWVLTTDSTEIELKLRQGLRFSDGETVTADDIVETFALIYAPDSANVLSDLLQADGPFQVEKIDESTVRLRFNRPLAAVEFLLTTVPVLPRHRFREPQKKVEEYWTLDTPPAEMAGLGPYQIAWHRPGEATLLQRNPHYWKTDREGRRLPYLDEIHISYVPDRNTQLLRFQAGELDLLDYQLRPEDYLELQGAQLPVYLRNAGPSGTLSFMWFNLSPGRNPETGKSWIDPVKLAWFQQVGFRRAVEAAVSRKAIAENVFAGLATPTRGLVPASFSAWARPELSRAYAEGVEASRQMLREGGFSWRTDGTGPEVLIDRQGRAVEFSLYTRSDDVWGKIAALIQQDLERLGMRVTLVQEEFRSLVSRVTRSRDYEAALMGLEFPYDPSDQANVLLSNSGMHFWNPSQEKPATTWEARIDELMQLQSRSLDVAERRRLYGEIQDILVEQVPLIPLVHRDVLVAAQPRVRNLRPSTLFPNCLWNSWEIWIQEGSQDR